MIPIPSNYSPERREQLIRDMTNVFFKTADTYKGEPRPKYVQKLTRENYDPERARQFRQAFYLARRNEAEACKKYWEMMPNGRVGPGISVREAQRACSRWQGLEQVTSTRVREMFENNLPEHHGILRHLYQVHNGLLLAGLEKFTLDVAYETASKVTELLFEMYSS